MTRLEIEDGMLIHKCLIFKKLEFDGLDTKTMRNVMNNYSLTEGPLDYSCELTSLIFASNIAKINT